MASAGAEHDRAVAAQDRPGTRRRRGSRRSGRPAARVRRDLGRVADPVAGPPVARVVPRRGQAAGVAGVQPGQQAVVAQRAGRLGAARHRRRGRRAQTEIGRCVQDGDAAHASLPARPRRARWPARAGRRPPPGRPGPATVNSDSRCLRTASRSSPLVRRTRSTSRAYAWAACPLSTSMSAASCWAAMSSGSAVGLGQRRRRVHAGHPAVELDLGQARPRPRVRGRSARIFGTPPRPRPGRRSSARRRPRPAAGPPARRPRRRRP